MQVLALLLCFGVLGADALKQEKQEAKVESEFPDIIGGIKSFFRRSPAKAADPAPSSSEQPAETTEPVAATPTEDQDADISSTDGSKRVVQTLHNYNDIEYTGTIKLGGQRLRAIYDTGSFELMVFSKKCASASCVNSRRFFDPTMSSSLNETTWTRLHAFGSGDCVSLLAKDRMEIGSISIDDHPFWEVTEANMDILKEGTFEAIMGVSHPNQPIIEIEGFLENDKKELQNFKRHREEVPEWFKSQQEQDTKFMNLMQTHPAPLKALESTVFSVCFNPEAHRPGTWIWNDHNPQELRSDLFTQLQVTGQTTWSSRLTRVYLDDTANKREIDIGCNKGHKCAVLFDTGTSLLSAPTKAVETLQRRLDQAQYDCGDLQDMPNLVMIIDGRKIELPAIEYFGIVEGAGAMLMSRGGGSMPQLSNRQLSSMEAGSQLNATQSSAKMNQCVATLMSMNIDTTDGDLWIMGMPFFRHYYTTFHLGNDPKYQSNDVTRNIFIAPNVEGKCEHPMERMQKRQQPRLLYDASVGKKFNAQGPRHINMDKVLGPRLRK